jgi:3,4-dihydroxy 2-butanone 4-phosphate synthase / GTP cyclohydrolase II
MIEEQNFVGEAIAAIARGEIVLVTDDFNRENEGDLILAAQHATPEQIGLMVRHTTGIICAPMHRSIARRLQLPPMVAENDAPLGTAFTVTVDLRRGLSTGISAEERCNTVRALANPSSSAAEFVRPGHVFPLIARDGGVLLRSGHTEAAVDLCRLAGLELVGVLAELVNDNGSVMRGAEIASFAVQHDLQRISVADLIAWRQRTEKLIERVAEFPIITQAGPARALMYRTPFDATQHLAVLFGDVGDGKRVPVRLHRESVVEDVFGQRSGLENVLARIAAEGRGVVVYLREGSTGVADEGERISEGISTPTGKTAAWRDIGLGAQILQDLGVKSTILIASRNRHYVGLDGFGISIEETELTDR